jgi:outer membrane protein OmpA-like peptidoglycan-associated protein
LTADAGDGTITAVELASAHEAEDAPQRPPPASAPGAIQQHVLAGTIGNAAVARLASARRHDGRGAAARRPAPSTVDGGDTAVLARGADLLRAAVEARNAGGTPKVPRRAPRLSVQRDIVPVPACTVPNTWTSVGPNNPSPTCTPYECIAGISPTGAANWRFYYSIVDVPKVLGERCNCDAVRTGYDLFFRAGVPRSRRSFRFGDDGNCISEQLAKSRAHNRLETAVVAKWQARQDNFVPMALGSGREVEIDLIDAVDKSFITPVDPAKPLSSRRVDRDIEYPENNLAGGLLFGGGSATGRTTDDSEFGPDTRDLSGTIRLRRTDDGSDPSAMTVSQTITFRYAIHDALDFCPGNTRQKDSFTIDRLEYNEMITVLSRLEASGLARDVEYNVDYHREKSFDTRIPLAAPTPVPKKVVRVPAEILFDFDKDEPKPGAAAHLLKALGDQPRHQDPTKSVEVRGYTDSKGTAAYNLDLSQRRANNIARLLESVYPNLAGQVRPVGKGMTDPIAPNTNPDGSDNPAGRASNRRVDIEFDVI